MTVIVTVISRHCTAHATDSFITCSMADGTLEVCEEQQTKIVPVKHFRGAMTYWGLAKDCDGSWSTLEWLQAMSREARDYKEPEKFAIHMRDSLNLALSQLSFNYPLHRAIGIHFTAYEWIDNRWIPELFVLSNYRDPRYNALHEAGVLLNRQTYNVAFKCAPAPEHGEPTYRIKVHEYLAEGRLLLYNNGDPAMFNPVAEAMLEQFKVLAERGELARPEETKTYRQIARLPVEVMSQIQRDFAKDGKRRIGGKPHDISITPEGIFESDTGDLP